MQSMVIINTRKKGKTPGSPLPVVDYTEKEFKHPQNESLPTDGTVEWKSVQCLERSYDDVHKETVEMLNKFGHAWNPLLGQVGIARNSTEFKSADFQLDLPLLHHTVQCKRYMKHKRRKCKMLKTKRIEPGYSGWVASVLLSPNQEESPTFCRLRKL